MSDKLERIDNPQNQKKLLILEEWKVARSTLIEFDHILSKIRYLDVTVTVALFAAGFNFSINLFLIAAVVNIAFLLLEYHYHKYLIKTADYARKLEEALEYKITTNLYLARNEYKNYGNKSIQFYIGWIIANIYYCLYAVFILISVFAYIFCVEGSIQLIIQNGNASEIIDFTLSLT